MKCPHSLAVVDPLVGAVSVELLLALPAEVVESCITAPQVLTLPCLGSNVQQLLSRLSKKTLRNYTENALHVTKSST